MGHVKETEARRKTFRPWEIARFCSKAAIVILAVSVLSGCAGFLVSEDTSREPPRVAQKANGDVTWPTGSSGSYGLKVSGRLFSVRYKTAECWEAHGKIRHYKLVYVLIAADTNDNVLDTNVAEDLEIKRVSSERVLVKLGDVERELPLGCVMLFEAGQLKVLSENGDVRWADKEYLKEFVEEILKVTGRSTLHFEEGNAGTD